MNNFVILLLIFTSYVVGLFKEPQSFISFIDVGQGDSTFLHTESGVNILVDTGANYSSVAYLENELNSIIFGCNLDLVVITHDQRDHNGSLGRLLKRCSANSLTFNDVSCAEKDCVLFGQKIPKNSLNKSCEKTFVTINDVNIKFLWPVCVNNQDANSNFALEPPKSADPNEDSIVILLQYGKTRVLIPGDAPTTVLDKIALSGALASTEGMTNIYKVAHHGSKNSISTALLEAFRPSLCVISVGSDNGYGHPHAETLKVLNDYHCKVVRTDQLGTIKTTF